MSVSKLLILLNLSIFFVSCSSILGPNRTFIDEMDYQPESFFRPNKDFPVLAGDTGKVRPTRKEMMMRTPASVKEKGRYSYQSALQMEEQKLVSGLSEWERDHFEASRRYLPTASERIYFLRLPSVEARDKYMTSRGHYVDYKHRRFKELLSFGRDELTLGMSKGQVMTRWGRPTRVDVAGDPKYENERWIFYGNRGMQYVYFEGGIVSGWSKPGR